MRITIGITTFNEGNYLTEAWNSVLNQSSDKWQAVMILDGGSDRTTQNIFQNIKHPKLIKHSYNENQGPYTCRTKAIELTETDWYFHLDADDLLPKNAVELVLNMINQEPNVMYITGSCEYFSLGSTQIICPENNPEIR